MGKVILPVQTAAESLYVPFFKTKSSTINLGGIKCC